MTYKVTGTKLQTRYMSTAMFKTTGNMYAWGFGQTYGELGLSDITNRSSPVQIGTLSNWSQISIGNHSAAAIKTDGTLWTWGFNIYLVLGLTDTTNKSSPNQVVPASNWSQVSAGWNHIAAIKTDGTLWAWGNSATYGQLGLGDTANKSTPIQVGALSNWSQVSCGQYYTAAVKTNGTLWTWGLNGLGQLGADVTNRSSPVQVGTLSNWSKISAGQNHIVAVKTDGTLWTCGGNSLGQLGLGDLTHRSSPVQIGTLSNWSKVSSSSGSFFAAAIKTDGTLWTWGNNTFGQLGLGDLTHRSSPTQVGTLSNWSKISCGQFHTAAVKTDGTLWTWGLNAQGRLGLLDTTNRSSPMQVGTLSNWSNVTGGIYSTMGLQIV
jgi:alpha-tubulin suppressor-like RCC1 family protein